MRDEDELGGELLPEFPQQAFEAVCFRALGLIANNREYLEQHIARRGGDESAMQALGDIQAACVRLDRTLNEMMELLSCMRGAAMPKRRVFDMRVLADELASQGERIKRELGIELVFECAPEISGRPCMVYADKAWAEQICMHLLSNALHACDAGGHIKLCLSGSGGSVSLSVEDDGCGLPEVSARARRENRSRFMGGAGAGLMLCREYCRLMGWSLTLDPSPAGGTKAVLCAGLCTGGQMEKELELCSRDKSESGEGDRLGSLLTGEVALITEGRRNGPKE